jgi:DNA-binding GntR family transcriptional regulator
MQPGASISALVPPDEAVQAAARRRGQHPRTLPEQIADHLGVAIVNGEYRGGERVREQALAGLYGVSRGPVREAIRMLEKRGLVELFPRRGAYVVQITLEAIADIFNIRATLLGLAARCFARVPTAEGLADLERRAEPMRALLSEPDADPVEFALAVGRHGAAIYRHCGNGQLTRMLRGQNEGSLWGLIWRERPLDFHNLARRQEAVADWTRVRECIQGGDDATAERITRKALFDSRDAALETLRRMRQQVVHPSRRIRD